MSKELKIVGALGKDYQQIYIDGEATSLFIDGSGHIKTSDIKSEPNRLTLSSTELFAQDGSGNSFTPSHNDHIATKKYVDDNAGGTAYHYQMHQFYASATTDVYVPFGASTVEGSSTATSMIDDTYWIAPFSGKIITAYIYCRTGTGATDLKLRRNGTLGSSLLSGGTVSISNSTVGTFTCDQNNTFSAGDYLNLYIDITNAPYQATMTTVWEVD